MNRFIRLIKNLSFLLYFVFLFISFYFFITGKQELGGYALLWSCAYIIVEYGFLSILKSRLLDKRQVNYKIVFLYENRKTAEAMIDNVKEIMEIQDFLKLPSVTSCNFMDYQFYHSINPKVVTDTFPCYIVINGENLIDDRILLKKPLFHSDSTNDVIDFISKHQRAK